MKTKRCTRCGQVAGTAEELGIPREEYEWVFAKGGAVCVRCYETVVLPVLQVAWDLREGERLQNIEGN